MRTMPQINDCPWQRCCKCPAGVTSSQDRGLDEVTRYSLDGGATALPSLQTARGGHACGHFIDNKNNQVTIVILFVVSQQMCSCHLCYRSYWLLEELMVTTSCPLQRSWLLATPAGDMQHRCHSLWEVWGRDFKLFYYQTCNVGRCCFVPSRGNRVKLQILQENLIDNLTFWNPCSEESVMTIQLLWVVSLPLIVNIHLTHLFLLFHRRFL